MKNLCIVHLNKVITYSSLFSFYWASFWPHIVSFSSPSCIATLSTASQPAWSRYPLPLLPLSCTRTLTWTVTRGRAASRGRSRSAGTSCGPRTAPWGTARGRPGARSKEKRCYSKRGEGSSLLPTHSPPLFLTLPLSLWFFFNTKTSHASSMKKNSLKSGLNKRERWKNMLEMCCPTVTEKETPLYWNFLDPTLSQYGGWKISQRIWDEHCFVLYKI